MPFIAAKLSESEFYPKRGGFAIRRKESPKGNTYKDFAVSRWEDEV
jgi:hypothetical protein